MSKVIESQYKGETGLTVHMLNKIFRMARGRLGARNISVGDSGPASNPEYTDGGLFDADS